MRKLLSFLTTTEKGQKLYERWFLIIGVAMSIFITFFFYEKGVSNFWFEIMKLVSAILGFVCVYQLGQRKNIGNVTGILANLGEIITQFSFGAFGLAINPLFYSGTHVYGLITWNKTAQEDGTIKTEKTNKNAYLSMGVFLLIASAIVAFLHFQYDYFAASTPLFFAMNIVSIIIGTIAQGTMIAKYKISWWFWFASNVLMLIINLATGNYIFAAQTLLYEFNVVLTLYDQYINNK